jgi:hypothetical protein
MRNSLHAAALLLAGATAASGQFPLQSPQRPSLPLSATNLSSSLIAAPNGGLLYSGSFLSGAAPSYSGYVNPVDQYVDASLQGRIVAYRSVNSSSLMVLDDGRFIVFPYTPGGSGRRSLLSPGAKTFSQFEAVGLFNVSPSYTGSSFVSTREGGVIRLTFPWDPALAPLQPWPSNLPAVHEIFSAYTLWNYNNGPHQDRLLVHGRDGSLSLRDQTGEVVGEQGVPVQWSTDVVQVLSLGQIFVVLKSDGKVGGFMFTQPNGGDQEAIADEFTLAGLEPSATFNRIERAANGLPGVAAYADGEILLLDFGDWYSLPRSASVRQLGLDFADVAKVVLRRMESTYLSGLLLSRSGEVFIFDLMSPNTEANLTLAFENCVEIGIKPSPMTIGSATYAVTLDGQNYIELNSGNFAPVGRNFTLVDGGGFLSSDISPALGFSLPVLARLVSDEILRHDDNYGLATKPDLLTAVQEAATQTVSQVQADPGSYNLFSAEQYAANYNNGISAGTALVTANPGSYNLYTSNSIMDLRMGGLMVQKQGSAATVTFQPQSTTDLSQPFTNNGTAITNEIPMPGNKGFIRIQAKP